MGEFDLSWENKFSNIGWRPITLSEKVKGYIRESINDPVIGAIYTGDSVGEIISVSLSKVDQDKRIETTLLGFTIGGDNSISQREIITPKNRIIGSLCITSRNFIICGKEFQIIPFSKIFATAGSRNTRTASEYELHKLGVIEYSFLDDIYISRIKLNKEIVLERGYDELAIAIVIGMKRQNPYEEIWKQIERIIAL